MSQITVELHEKFPHERIEQWEHDAVHEEMKRIGFLNIANSGGLNRRLPRATYFAERGSREEMGQAWANLRRRLGREVRLEGTLGPSFGFGLEPTSAPVTNANRVASALTTPYLNSPVRAGFLLTSKLAK